MNAVLDAANVALADLPEEVLTAQDAYDRLTASTANFTAETGEVINRALLPLIVATTEFINALDDEDIRNFMEIMISLGSVFVAFKVRAIAVKTFLLAYPILVRAATLATSGLAASLSVLINPFTVAGAVIF